MRTQVTIDFQLNQDVSADIDTSTLEGNNVSNNTHMLDDSFEYRGYKGFQLAASADEYPAVANGLFKYFPSDGYKGYMSSQLSDSDGYFENAIKLTITLTGGAPESIYLKFDPTAVIYATEIQVSFKNGNAKILTNKQKTEILIPLQDILPVYSFGINTYILSIRFPKINKPYQSLRLTKVSLNYVGVYTQNVLKKFENSEQAFNSSMTVSAGLITQYADITIYDRTGILHNLAKDEKLKSRQKVTIYVIQDDGTKIGIGSYKTDNWDVQGNSSDVDVTCTDDTDALSNIYCLPAEVTDRSVHNLLTLAFSNINAPWQYIDSDTEEYCKSIITPNNWYYSSSIKEFLEKICQLGQLSIYNYQGIYIIMRCY